MPENTDWELPLVSVVTPSYNQGRYIEATLQSVMQQDYPRIQHIVVDGGSTDETVEILKRYEKLYDMKWTSQPDRGQSDAINKGFARAEGAVIGWLNSDDVYVSRNVVRDVVNAFDASPETGLIYGDHIALDADNLVLRVARIHPRFDRARLLRLHRLSQPAAFYRAGTLHGQPLDEACDLAMDYDLHLRLAGDGVIFRHMAAPLAGFRITPETKTSARYPEQLQETLAVRRRYGYRPSLKGSLLEVLDKASYLYLRLSGAAPLLKMYARRNDAAWWAFPARFDSPGRALWRQFFG
jgi:glycosyltransferase involved in cell wall biosynthesis